ncbi:MAG TPA: hypothetical protein ENK44_14885 [Caldithrix abyssi]|uniref:Outer membrane protein beta-barrel domain-containing protein n=1 Tax=Caldithrix abyssi TaxID=187145 RepID=A0A7V4U2U0_CALAY|nr:hypothetical protein [Caldithrix abyssi]
MRKNFIILHFFLCFVMTLKGQENIRKIGLTGSMVGQNLVDEYISINEYNGVSFAYGLKWEDRDCSRLTGILFSFNKIADMANGNTSAEVMDFTLSWWYVYNLVHLKLWERPFRFDIGPGGEIDVLTRQQRIAQKNMAASHASVIAADFFARLLYSLSRRFSVDSELAVALLSVTSRPASKNTSEKKNNPFGFTHPFNMLHGRFSIGLDVVITKSLYAQIGYSARIWGIFTVDDFRFLQDRLNLEIGYRF